MRTFRVSQSSGCTSLYGLVILAFASHSAASAPTISGGPTISVDQNAVIVPGVTTPLSSLVTITPPSNPAIEASVLYLVPQPDYTINGASENLVSGNSYRLSSSPLPSWTTITLTADPGVYLIFLEGYLSSATIDAVASVPFSLTIGAPLLSELGETLYDGLQTIKHDFQQVSSAIGQVRNDALAASAIATVATAAFPGFGFALPELYEFEAELIAAAQVVKNPLPPGADPPLPTITPEGIISPQIAAEINETISNMQLGITLTENIEEDIVGINTDGTTSNVADAGSLESQAEADLSSLQATASEVSALFKLLEGELNAAGLPNFTITQADLASYINQIETNGFPSNELEFFADLGLTSADIDSALSDLQGIDLTSVPLSLYSFFDATSQAYADASVGVLSVPEPVSLVLLGPALACLVFASISESRYRRLNPRKSG